MWEIYAYGNTELLQLIFDGVVMVMGSDDYYGLIRIFAMVAFLAVFVSSLMSARFEGFKWFIGLFFIYSVMFVPRVDVVIVDRLTTAPPYTVANVPLGLGLFGHATSKIGDWLTRAFETVFTLPADLKYGANGPLFGHRVIELTQLAEFQNSEFKRDMNNFFRDCTLYDITEGRINPNALRNAPIGAADTWVLLGGTNPARLTTSNNVVTDCRSAWLALNTQMNAQVTGVMALIGRKANPLQTPAAAAAAMPGQLESTYNYMASASAAAMDIMRQSLVINQLQANGAASAAELGDSASAILEWSTAQARMQTKNAYGTMSNIAKETLPLIRNGIELIMYAVFPFVFLMMMMPIGMALAALKSYALALMWLQLWAPLYAVLNLVVTYHRAVRMPADTDGIGLTLASASNMFNGVITDADVAGYMVISIPMIAWMIVKGGDMAMSSVAGQLMQPSQSAAGQAAGATAMGNLSMGSVSHDVHSHNSHTGNTRDVSLKTVSDQMVTRTSELGVHRTGASGYSSFNQFQTQMSTNQTVDLTSAKRETEMASVNAASGMRNMVSAMQSKQVQEANAMRFEEGKSEADRAYDNMRVSVGDTLQKTLGKSVSQAGIDAVTYGLSAGLGLTAVLAKAGIDHRSVSAEELKDAENSVKNVMKEHGAGTETSLTNMYTQTSYYARTSSLNDSSAKEASAYFDRSLHHQSAAAVERAAAARTSTNMANAHGAMPLKELEAEVLRSQQNPSQSIQDAAGMLNSNVSLAIAAMPNIQRHGLGEAPAGISSEDRAAVADFEKKSGNRSVGVTISRAPEDSVKTRLGSSGSTDRQSQITTHIEGSDARATERGEAVKSADESRKNLENRVAGSTIPTTKETGTGVSRIANGIKKGFEPSDEGEDPGGGN